MWRMRRSYSNDDAKGRPFFFIFYVPFTYAGYAEKMWCLLYYAQTFYSFLQFRIFIMKEYNAVGRGDPSLTFPIIA